jgi:hypothetical protein
LLSLSSVLSPSPRLVSQLTKQGLLHASSTASLHVGMDGGFTPLGRHHHAALGTLSPGYHVRASCIFCV